MKKQRPMNLAIQTMALPITAYASILHRISAVVMWVGFAFYLPTLWYSLRSPENFALLHALRDESTIIQLFLWAFLTAMGYYLCGGVKHLIQEAGHFESLEGGAQISWACIAIGVLLSMLSGVWIWL
ncbi:succinate dehydrogenase, cytochrome b556 subunit [Pseudoalteromonas sp. MMG005]|uniref:succinate dehydrogenase, cytochrome b556 subunit n=1 Tax=Pseudoalteromonas sp. MMG005 TaxID=2822682 RepID=UPI001B39F04E|nr:succinate dehydrogenase, cytochrome b556 subunit [Pseudoalteromonas sp. MMG005]MBQ4844787.1 succinate dehydrogenase, cytochrome b556 subunit [Pseudoalteromonas sp. MMG005]